MPTEIPLSSPGRDVAPPAPSKSSAVSLEDVKNAIPGFVAGMLKGNSVDLLGLPVDLINQTLGAVGMKSRTPIGGADSIRAMLGIKPQEADTTAEIGGSFVSPAGLSKAMVVGAARVLRKEGYVDKDIARIINSAQSAEILDLPGAKADVFKMTGVYADKALDTKAIISDKEATLRHAGVVDVGMYNNTPIVFMTPSKTNTPVALEDILRHDELFSLYPELRNYSVKNIEGAIGDAMFYKGDKTIGMGPQKSVEDFRSSLLHEVQHVVQGIEAFRPGTNPNILREFNAVDLTPERLQRIRDLREEGNPHAEKIAQMLNFDTRQAFQKYLKTPGEVEARMTEENRNLTKAEANSKIYDLISTDTPESLWAK